MAHVHFPQPVLAHVPKWALANLTHVPHFAKLLLRHVVKLALAKFCASAKIGGASYDAGAVMGPYCYGARAIIGATSCFKCSKSGASRFCSLGNRPSSVFLVADTTVVDKRASR